MQSNSSTTVTVPPDDVLVAAYVASAVTADRIATNQQHWIHYRAALPAEWRSADHQAVAARLISLRKQGRLPRLFRNGSQER